MRSFSQFEPRPPAQPFEEFRAGITAPNVSNCTFSKGAAWSTGDISIESLLRTAAELRKLPKPISAVIVTPAARKAIERQCRTDHVEIDWVALPGGRPGALWWVELHERPILCDCLELARSYVERGRRVCVGDDERFYPPEHVEAMLADQADDPSIIDAPC